MTMETFKKACELAKEYGAMPFLGGGEPTLHPQFSEFLGWCIVNIDDAYGDGRIVGVVTNGTHEKLTLRLLELENKEIITARVSVDTYHDYSMLTDKTYRAVKSSLPRSVRFGEDIPRVMRLGRAHNWGTELTCDCGDVIEPNGDFYFCACRKTYLGNINTGIDLDKWHGMKGLYEDGCESATIKEEDDDEDSEDGDSEDGDSEDEASEDVENEGEVNER